MRIERSRGSFFLGLALAAGAVAGTFAYAGSASAAEILSVKNESANFRDGPGDKHAIVYSADKFYPVEVLEKKDAWVKVKDFEGDVAWVAERLLAKQETVVVEGDKVNVREKPNTSSEITFKSERGEVFKVESHQGKWLKIVDANGDGGWIRDDMVWGEKGAVAETPKGKTKGEIEDPTAKGGIPPAGDKPLEKAGHKPKSDKADKGEKADKSEKAEPRKDAKPGAKPAAATDEKAKAADENKLDPGAQGDDAKTDDDKTDEPAPAKADDDGSDAKSDDDKG